MSPTARPAQCASTATTRPPTDGISSTPQLGPLEPIRTLLETLWTPRLRVPRRARRGPRARRALKRVQAATLPQHRTSRRLPRAPLPARLHQQLRLAGMPTSAPAAALQARRQTAGALRAKRARTLQAGLASIRVRVRARAACLWNRRRRRHHPCPLPTQAQRASAAPALGAPPARLLQLLF